MDVQHMYSSNIEKINIPMAYRNETNIGHPIIQEFLKTLQKDIIEKVAPLSCFGNNRIEREKYFLDVHKYMNVDNLNACDLLYKMALDYYNQPYCYICHYSLKPIIEENNITKKVKIIRNSHSVIEHEHDDSKKTGNKIPGRFRGKTCKKCNRLESIARKYKTKTEKIKYWHNSFMKNFNSNEYTEMCLDNLEMNGYLFDIFTHY